MADSVEETQNPTERPDPVALSLHVKTPEAVDAASTFLATVHVATDPIADLRGERLTISDGDDTVASDIVLVDVDDHGVHTTEPVELAAPTTLGTHTWTVKLEPPDPKESPYEATTVPFDVAVKAHDTRVQAWGAPSAIAAGQTFHMKVGMKCSSGCDLSGRGFDIIDEEGATLVSSAVGQETWKGTKGLFYTEVELTAPNAAGYADWRVETHPVDTELPHDAGTAKFGVKTVPTPQHTVRITALDDEKGEPIEGLQVLMHPFRALTNATGVAEVQVPEGKYRLYVSGLRYYPHDSRVEITENLETTVELVWEKRPMKIS